MASRAAKVLLGRVCSVSLQPVSCCHTNHKNFSETGGAIYWKSRFLLVWFTDKTMESDLMPSVRLPPGFIWHLCSKMFMGRRQNPFLLAPLQVTIWIHSVCIEISVGLWCGIFPPQITDVRAHERARKNCFWLFDQGEKIVILLWQSGD